MNSRFKQVINEKRFSFFEGLAVFFLICMVALAFFLVWFWGYLSDIEKQTPEASLIQLNSLIKKGEYEKLYEQGDYTLSEFNTKEGYINAIKNIFPQEIGELTFAKVPSQDAGTKLYNAYSGDKFLAEIQLLPLESNGFAYTPKIVIKHIKETIITAPAFITVYSNGTALTEDYIAERDVPIPMFKDYPSEAKPTATVYKLPNLLQAPQITAKSPDETACNVTKQNEHTFSITAVPGAENLAEYTALIEKLAKTYAPFTSDDLAFSEFSKYLVPDSPFYKAMRGYSAAWIVEHDRFDFENMQVANLEKYSEDTFCGEVTFTYVIYRGTKVHTFPSHYKMTFVKIDGAWKLLSMQTL